MSDFFAISVDRATQDELNQVHEVVKEHAYGWWHRHVSFWLVGGLTATQWRDLIKPCLLSGSDVLVLRLPAEESDRNWAFTGPNAKEKCQWIHHNYR